MFIGERNCDWENGLHVHGVATRGGLAQIHAGQGGPRTDNRRFLNSLHWMARPGGRWRDLPELIGRLRKRKRRYYRWIEMGVRMPILAPWRARPIWKADID